MTNDIDPDLMPDVHDGALDDEGVRRLLGDIEACAMLHSISIKRGPTIHADEQPQGVKEAVEALFNGNARAIQLRYQHRAQHWTDTILRSDVGYRLIRVAAPTAAS